MATERKFAGFQSKGAPSFRMSSIPSGGMCLSSFVMLMNSQGKVLMGKLNPEFDWDHIGALDDERKKRHTAGWMLPGCHLLIGESPKDAADRILGEQLGLSGIELAAPEVYSETYSPSSTGEVGHWDIEFVFKGKHEGAVTHPAWKELSFVDPNAPESEFARGHQDVLRNAGLRR